MVRMLMQQFGEADQPPGLQCRDDMLRLELRK